jgi:chromosome segregation and condensation protein ScpB
MNSEQLKAMREILSAEVSGRGVKISAAVLANLKRRGWLDESGKSTREGRAAVLAAWKKS